MRVIAVLMLVMLGSSVGDACKFIQRFLNPTTTPPVTTTTLAPPEPPGCFYEGEYIEPDDGKFVETSDACYYVYCSYTGEVDMFSCPTTTPPTTTTSLAPPLPPGCVYNGEYYEPDTGKYVEISDACYYVHCSDTGEITEVKCPTTTTPPTTTTLAPPLPPGCEYNGQFYKPDTESVVEVPDGCYRIYCTEQGEILMIKCTTTTPPTTTTVGPPLPPGCEYNGEFYEPDSGKLVENSDNCYYVYCSYTGKVDVIHCPTTTPPTTTTTLGPPLPPGCVHNGEYYEPDSGKLVETSDSCYYVYCSYTGKVDLINCPTTTPPTRTTTVGPPLPPGCVYNGEYYEPDTGKYVEISDACYYVHCSDTGEVTEVKCPTTTTPPTTITLAPPLPPDCEYNGQFFKPGTITEIDGNMDVMCSDDGELHIIMP